MLNPIIDELATEYTYINFGKVDVDVNVELMKKHGVRSIPTLIIIKNNEVVDRIVGVASKLNIERILNKHIN